MDPAYELRRVGFRHGTVEELTALHAVEAPVEAERGSHRMPASLDAYVAYAHNLPSQFDDHSWLVSAGDGTPVAVGYCWSNATGDVRVMECDVLVRPDDRRRGIATELVRTIARTCEDEDRSRLTWSTYGSVPAGDDFSRRVGGRAARVNRESELVLADVDAALVDSWASVDAPRRLGYALDVVDGPFPEGLRGDAATFHHIMQTAPRDDLDVGDVVVDEAFVAELDRALEESGRRRWTLLVRAPDGTCVGGTEVTFEPDQPGVAFQQNTGIDPTHRGRGLAKWVKAAMLQRLRTDRPDVRIVRTGNAFSNAPMLAINDALGFIVVSTRTDWQADVDDVVAAIGGA